MKLSTLCATLSIDFHGDDTEITGLNTLEAATPQQVSFLQNKKYVSKLATTEAAAVLVEAAYIDRLPDSVIALVVDEPYLKLAEASALFASPRLEKNGIPSKVGEGSVIEANVFLADGCVIGENCHLMPGVFIGNNAHIGDGTVLYPNVTVYRDCVIGSGCIVHAGAVIGSDGFGFATTEAGRHVKIHQNGNVVIEDDVEIGANCAIDRAAFGSTVIEHGVRIDNLVQVGHNCEIGAYSVIVSQVGLAGSSTLGHHVVMGGQSATAGHLSIAPMTTIAARSGVTKSIKEPGKIWSGYPLMAHRKWLKLQGLLSKMLK